MKKKYFNLNSIKYYRDWTNEEWPFVIRRYNIYTHELDVKKTIDAFHSNSNDTFFTSLPPENEHYEN